MFNQRSVLLTFTFLAVLSLLSAGCMHGFLGIGRQDHDLSRQLALE